MRDFLGKQILVVGDGISGKAAYRVVKSLGASVTISNTPDKCDLIIVSPGVTHNHPVFKFAKDFGIEIIGELELGYELDKGEIIAVTGTNGKTTTVSLLGAIFAEAMRSTIVCGNIGYAYSAAAVKRHDYSIVEVSSFQLETTRKFAPHIAAILNITPDHLDRHGSMLAYKRAKFEIAAHQKNSDFIILPVELAADKLAMHLRGSMITVGEGGDCRIEDGWIIFDDEKILRISSLRMDGMHNVLNAAFATAAAKLSGVETMYIARALASFCPPRHRIEYVATKGGKRYYNDSKGTNIDATVCAVRTMRGSVCLLLGGSDKSYEFDELFTKLTDNVTAVIAFGAVRYKLAAAALRQGRGIIPTAEDLEEALNLASKTVAENVLLSPATASFDAYNSYAERGEHFIKLVEKLNVD